MADKASRGSLLVVFLTVFIDLLGFGMVLPLLPVYAEQFMVEESGMVIGLLMASFSAMQFLFAPVWGRLSDRFGRRPIILIGLAGSVVFYLLFGLATMWQSLTWLFISRIGAGIAGATISTAQAYIADVTSFENRARGMALIGAAFGLGFTFGPLIAAAALFDADGAAVSPWPGFAAAGLSAFALLLALAKLPESLVRSSQTAASHSFDIQTLWEALRVPSIALLMVTMFASVLSFGAFEQTLSLLLKNEQGAFRYSFPRILLVYAYIGVVLSVAQGGLVRQLAKRLSEAQMAISGAVVSVIGFVLLAVASTSGSLTQLLVAAAVEVVGFAFITPSVHSLISRRSDPTRQGGILGVAQSMGSLARIAGPLMSVPLFFRAPHLPYFAAVGLMIVATGLLVVGIRAGRDYPQSANAS